MLVNSLRWQDQRPYATQNRCIRFTCATLVRSMANRASWAALIVYAFAKGKGWGLVVH